MRVRKILCLAFSLLLSLPFFAPAPAARAESQPPWLSGTFASGILPADECPLMLDSMHVFFDVPAFPLTYYSSEELFSYYNATVTSEYHLINPYDETVTARYIMPLGTTPTYAFDFSALPGDDRYRVTTNRGPVAVTYRHTFYSGSGGPDYAENAGEPSDELLVLGGISPDTPVYRYTCSVLDAPDSSDIRWDVSKTREDQIIVYDEAFDIVHRGNATYSFGGRAEEGSAVNIYSVGEEVSLSTPQLRDSSGKIASGTLDVSDPEVMTFYDLALLKKTSDGISDTDRYNAVLEFLVKKAFGLCSESDLRLKGDVMRWISFELTLSPAERVTCRAVCPLYPTVNRTFHPYVYDYGYYPTPEDRWYMSGKPFYSIQTSFPLTRSSKTFSETSEGYQSQLQRQGCRDKLTFSLSQSESPQIILDEEDTAWQTAMLIAFLILGVLAIFLFSAFALRRRR